MLERTIAPPFGEITNPGIQQAEVISFANGSWLSTINAGDQPVIKCEITLDSGIWYENLSGLSWITAKILPEGTKNKSANQIAELFEFYGSFIEINPSFDNTSIAVYTPKKHFEHVMALLAEVLFQPAFNKDEIEILKTNKIQQLKVNGEKTNFVASRKIRESLFGLKHSYGQFLSEDDVTNLHKSDIEKYYNSSFLKAQKFFLSGLVDDKEIEIVKQYFDINQTNPDSYNKENVLSISSKNIFVEKPGSLQSSIRLGWQIPDKSHPDHFKLVLLNEILGGYFSSRLMKNLREDKGYTYGVNSYPVFLKQASFLIISADVIAESTQDAINEIHKELDVLKNEKVSATELETVRNYMAGSFLSSVSSPFQLMEKFKSINNHGLDYSYYDNFFYSLKNISSSDILETANEYLKTDGLHTVVVGKK
ncbi:pitrilysin family protein [Reichenbachiella sp. MALMAid0571]|uniref:M16 family metallopeptidase n=1 Tax=Reichenbachiella sp. MALMAid0571 TaxID=3143939 RepID=UPI0032DFFD9D